MEVSHDNMTKSDRLKRSFIGKMEGKMRKAKFLLNYDMNSTFYTGLGDVYNSTFDVKNRLSRTAPVMHVNSIVLSHNSANNMSNCCRDNHNCCHDNHNCCNGIGYKMKVVKLNITVSYNPALETSSLIQLPDYTIYGNVGCQDNQDLPEKEYFPEQQSAILVNMEQTSLTEDRSEESTPLQTPNMSPHSSNSPRKIQRSRSARMNRKPDRQPVQRSGSHRIPRHKSDRRGRQNEQDQTPRRTPPASVDDTSDAFTLHVPTLLSVDVPTTSNMQDGSESEDEITLKADLTQTHDIHKLGTLLCEASPGLRSTTPSTNGDRSRNNSARSRNTTSESSCQTERNRDGYDSAISYSPCSSRHSRPPSDLYSVATNSDNYYSKGASDRNLQDFVSPDADYFDVCSPSEGDYLSAPEHESRNEVYTPYAVSEPDHRERATSNNSFHNIISTISDLEQKLGPEKHEDLKFLREILENDNLSALHRAVQTAGQKPLHSQSTPHLGNVYNVAGGLKAECSNVDNQPSKESLKTLVSEPTFMSLLRAADSVAQYNWEQVDTPPDDDIIEDPDDMVTIRFTKADNQPLGATIVEDERTGAIRIKRIMEQSPIASCNKIHAGDELKKINGASVAGKSVDDICQMLGRLSNDCTLTVSTFGAYPDERDLYTVPKSRYFRAFFNYDPKNDQINPCQDASFTFELGDILEVVNTDDECWWQAKKYGTPSVGLIPSSEQRLRYLNSRSAKAAPETPLYKREHSRKQKKKKDFLFTFGDKEQKEPLTYIEVTHVRPSRTKRRPIIITGAKGFGGSCIREKMLHDFPTKYFTPIRHTTKTGSEGYTVCTKKEFTTLMKKRDLIEYTKVSGHYYGTSYQSVRDLIVTGKICLLDVHPQYLPVLCNGTLRPHVIFVEATTEERIKEFKQSQPHELPAPQRKLNGSEIRELRFNSERLLRRYTEFIDTIITLESLTSAVDLIDQVTDRIIEHPAWMPRKWLEST